MVPPSDMFVGLYRCQLVLYIYDSLSYWNCKQTWLFCGPHLVIPIRCWSGSVQRQIAVGAAGPQPRAPRMSEYISDKMPNRMPKRMPDIISEYMLDKISAFMRSEGATKSFPTT